VLDSSNAYSLSLGDVADKRFRLLQSVVVFRGLFNYLCVFVHCAKTAENIDTVSFAYDSPMSQIVLKFGFNLSTPSSPNFVPK